MTKPGNSLSGKNSGGRASGNRSSRFSPTNFNKLRNLDRQIAEIDKQLDFCKIHEIFGWPDDSAKLKTRRVKLDEKRKNLRNLRKGYKIKS